MATPKAKSAERTETVDSETVNPVSQENLSLEMSYMQRMKQLMKESETAKSLRRSLRKPTEEEVRARLRGHKLNANGDELEVRERLLRYSVRITIPDYRPPWYPEYDENPEAQPANRSLSCPEIWKYYRNAMPKEGENSKSLTVNANTGSKSGGEDDEDDRRSWVSETSPSKEVVVALQQQLAYQQKQIEELLAALSGKTEQTVDRAKSKSTSISTKETLRRTHPRVTVTDTETEGDQLQSRLCDHGTTSQSEVDSSEESEVDDRRSESSISRDRRSGSGYCIKVLKQWGLSFGGSTSEDADEFLESLKDCVAAHSLKDKELLIALPGIFKNSARLWCRENVRILKTWARFEKEFRLQYCKSYSDVELYDELSRRSQGHNEKVSDFVGALRRINGYFEKPVKEETLAELAYMRLVKGYRNYMSGKSIHSLNDILKYGRRYERELEIEDTYLPPVSKEKARIPNAAFEDTSKDRGRDLKNKITAKVAETSGVKHTPEKTKKPKEKKKKQKKQVSIVDVSDPSTEIAAAQQAIVQKGYNGERQQKKWPTKKATFNTAVKPPPTSPWAKTTSWAGTPAAYVSNPQATHTTPAQAQTYGQFPGACYECRAVGHMAAECPTRVCYTCGQTGHSSYSCSRRESASTDCQVCGTHNRTYTTSQSSTCTAMRIILGEANAGQQNRPSCPAISQELFNLPTKEKKEKKEKRRRRRVKVECKVQL